MKRSLLDMTQVILSDMNGDEVDTIDDTTEAEQVAVVIRETYYEIMSNRNWPHMERLFSLEASNDLAKPTHMKLPEMVKEMTFVNYNKIKSGETRNRFESVKYMKPDDFLHYTNNYNNDKGNIDVITDYTGIHIQILNDTAPTYYTSFDDQNIVMNSYDSEIDSTLQESKVQAKAIFMPTWNHVDEFIPDLPAEAFMYLIEEAKSTAFVVVRQEANQKAEQKAVRQQKWLSQNSRRANQYNIYPANFGRGGSRSSYPRHIPRGGDKNQ